MCIMMRILNYGFVLSMHACTFDTGHNSYNNAEGLINNPGYAFCKVPAATRHAMAATTPNIASEQ